jgi:hypothetical protein
MGKRYDEFLYAMRLAFGILKPEDLCRQSVCPKRMASSDYHLGTADFPFPSPLVPTEARKLEKLLGMTDGAGLGPR